MTDGWVHARSAGELGYGESVESVAVRRSPAALQRMRETPVMTGTSRATPALLWARAALLAAVVVLVSAVGHVSADGNLPGPLAMAALLGLTTVVSARFLTRQASTLRIVAMLVGGQAVIHGLLSVLAGHGTGPAGHRSAEAGSFVFDGRHVERTGSYFDQVAAMQASSAPDPGPVGSGASAGWMHVVEHLGAQSPLMLVAHLLVVVALGVWLAVGEAALWAVLTLMGSTLLGVVGALVALGTGRFVALLLQRVRRTPVPRGLQHDAVPLLNLLRHVVAHRGPPALLAS